MILPGLKKFKAIIFDADGVIINPPEKFSDWYQREFNLPDGAMAPFFKGVFLETLNGKIDLKEAVKPWLKAWKWEGTAEEFLNLWFESNSYIDAGLVETIKGLKEKGVRCFLASNQEKYRANYLRNEIGFEKMFDRIYFSCDIGLKKPNLDFFQFVAADLKAKDHIDPEGIMFWDDKQACVESANKAGFNGYVYKDFDSFKKVILCN